MYCRACATWKLTLKLRTAHSFVNTSLSHTDEKAHSQNSKMQGSLKRLRVLQLHSQTLSSNAISSSTN